MPRRGTSRTEVQAALKRSIGRVAEALGNTPAVSRQSYIAPAVVRAHLEGSITRGAGDPETVADKPVTRREELALVRLLDEIEHPRAKAAPRAKASPHVKAKPRAKAGPRHRATKAGPGRAASRG